jgi:hypothetical protein
MLIIQSLDLVLAKKFPDIKWKLYKKASESEAMLTFSLYKNSPTFTTLVQTAGVTSLTSELQTLVRHLGMKLVGYPHTEMPFTNPGRFQLASFRVDNAFAEMVLTPDEFSACLASLS